jgi:anti-anti-sigma factor
MEVSKRQEQGLTVVSVSGRLDAATTPDFEKQGSAWVSEGGGTFVLDFTGLTYISSAGLRGILSLAKKLRATEGRLALCGLSGLVKDVIGVSGFEAFLSIYDTLEEVRQGDS